MFLILTYTANSFDKMMPEPDSLLKFDPLVGNPTANPSFKYGNYSGKPASRNESAYLAKCSG